jgi:hypothetical protein
LNELGTALDQDNVSDIDQFVQGFEEWDCNIRIN